MQATKARSEGQDNMDPDRDTQVNEGYMGHSLEGEMEVETARGKIAV